MKTPAFVPLLLFVLLAGYALAAEPRQTREQKARIAAVVAETPCPKCLEKAARFDSFHAATNVMKQTANGKFEPVGKWEYYGLKCRKCGEKFRIWKELGAGPPAPTPTPTPARTPADTR